MTVTPQGIGIASGDDPGAFLFAKMAKDYAKPFYHSTTWKKVRAAFIAHRVSIDGGLCQRCHENLGYIVHHSKYLDPMNITDANVALNWDNFEYVCKPCHDKEHLHMKPELLCGFDAEGRPIDASPEKRDQNEILEGEERLRSDLHG